MICNKCDLEAKLREKNQRRRTVQGTSTEAARQTATRVNPQLVQPVGVQSSIMPTAQAVKHKILKCNECGVSGAEERRLFLGTYALCITCAAVSYKLKLESLELCRASNIIGSSHRRSEGRGLNNDQHFDGHVPRSLNDVILYATVHTGEIKFLGYALHLVLSRTLGVQ